MNNKKAILLYPFSNNNPDEISTGQEVYNFLQTQGYQVIKISLYDDNGNYKNSAKEAFDVINLGFNPKFILAMDYGPWPGLGWNKNNFPNTLLVYEAGDEPQAMHSHFSKSICSDIILTPDARCNSIYKDVFKKQSIWWTQFAIDSVYSKTFDVSIKNICLTTCGDRGEVTRYMKDSLKDNFVNRRFVTQNDHAEFLSSGTIVFQESKHKEITRRLMEGAALGKLVLADRPSKDTNYYEVFTEDEEIVWYDSKEDALEKAKYYLERPEECKRIGQNARKKVLNEHTCSARVKKLIELIETNF
jgi:hypothetical protein